MSLASMSKRIEQIENHLEKLKLMISESELKKINEKPAKAKQAKPKPAKERPLTIADCVKKADLSKFTVNELKAFIKENEIDIKNLSKKRKEDIVNEVWKKLKLIAKSQESESESESDDE